MDYIDGLVAAELRELKDCALGLFGTPEQDQNFRRHMAKIQVRLSTCLFDEIGCLTLDDQGDMKIGPDVLTGKGPWKSATDYYQDAARYAFS
jgi:hypothetical protein